MVTVQCYTGKGLADDPHTSLGARRFPSDLVRPRVRVTQPLPVLVGQRNEKTPDTYLDIGGLTKAGNGTRTRDPQLGKLMLYQLSYSRVRRLV